VFAGPPDTTFFIIYAYDVTTQKGTHACRQTEVGYAPLGRVMHASNTTVSPKAGKKGI
jgi:hypothetical protein